jgi:hypothetical protein
LLLLLLLLAHVNPPKRKGQGEPGGRASSPQAGFMDKDKEDNGKEGNGNDNHTPTRERRGIV